MAASFVWAAPVLHGRVGLGSRHPSTDGAMLSNSSPSAAPGEKKNVLRYFKLLAPFVPFTRGVPPASILLKKGCTSQRLETPEVVVFSGGSGRAMVPKQMSRAAPAPPRAPQRRGKKKKMWRNSALKARQPAAGLPGCCSPFTCFME